MQRKCLVSHFQDPKAGNHSNQSPNEHGSFRMQIDFPYLGTLAYWDSLQR
jgi:hypothetical protein